jgi:phospholipase/carboxylesterase
MRIFPLAILLILVMSIKNSVNAQSSKTDDLMLKYLIKEPSVKTAKLPVLILLHGVGSNEQDLFSMAKQLPKQMLIISARAPYTLSQGSYAWFHVDLSTGKPIYNSEEAEKSRNIILQFIDQVKTKYHTDEIYLMGFSQGAIMSYSIALTNPGKVKGFVALSGRILSDIKPHIASEDKLKKLPVFIGHGINDQTLPIFNGRAASKQCMDLHIPTTYKEYVMAHEISQQEFIDILEWFSKNLNQQ